MRRFVFAVLAGLAVIAAAMAVPTGAGAVTLTAPTGLAAAIGQTSATEQVRWHRHHWWGWHWPRPFWSGWRWHHPHWGWRRHHFWWGFPFFGSSWHTHHRVHHHRPHKASQQKQDGQEQKEEQPAQK